ncbi:MAG: DUF2842 domain-containing protein [Acetobacteraceae bacterium]|nr:DUF2842 domain-containing protein [Acetobacteraceae bacterium]
MSRPLVAFLVGTAGFIAYVMIVTALADPLVEAHWLLQLLFYALAGVAWVVPVVRLMRWGAGRSGPARPVRRRP